MSCSQQSEERLAEALERNESVSNLTIDLRSSHARELVHKYLQRNRDRRRVERKASVSHSSSPVTPRAGVKTADWVGEARRVSASEPFEYGCDPTAMSDETTYMVTGNPLWLRATDAEQIAVVEAFGSNCVVTSVEMVGGKAQDALAAAWGRALASNTTLTSLNLESNSIGSACATPPRPRRDPHLRRSCATRAHAWDRRTAQWHRGAGRGPAREQRTAAAQAGQPARELLATERGASSGGA